MRYFIVTLLAAFCSLCSFAGAEWTTYYNANNVKIEYRYLDCNDMANGIHQQKVIFRFQNSSTKKIELSFSKSLVYGQKRAPKDDVDTYTLILLPGQIIECDCSNKNNALFIFSKHLDFKGPELTHFDLLNIVVKPIE